MSKDQARTTRNELAALVGVLLLFACLSFVGITWGLPSRAIDQYLFDGIEPWSGEKIHRLAGAEDRFSANRGADVDVDPLDKSSTEPIDLTATEEDVAQIYLRYRLFTYQPDEMITMMALSGMRPSKFDLDPRLYQYGGLFIYPVGALIKTCDIIGLIDVRGDVVYYLDNPDEFGKFYIAARAYSAAWGLVGVLIVFAMARRFAGSRAGLLAALLFTLMPVVVCMAHEGKPHLPGAVLMLAAVLFAMRHLDRHSAISSGGKPRVAPGGPDLGGMGKRSLPVEQQAKAGSRDWWLMCICCGAAFGMVLSSLPIFILIPLVVYLDRRGGATELTTAFGRAATGVAAAATVYLVANPYILINAVANREVLASNFGNSLAMYEIDRIIEGLVRVIQLTIEGATLPVLLVGGIAGIVAMTRRSRLAVPLIVPTAIFFLQFVLIGAGKPAEYGRFGIFANTALAIGAACLVSRTLDRPRTWLNRLTAAALVLWTGAAGVVYVGNFVLDTASEGSRLRLARSLSGSAVRSNERSDQEAGGELLVVAEPAPYCCPPLPFHRLRVALRPNHAAASDRRVLFTADDPSDPLWRFKDPRSRPGFKGIIAADRYDWPVSAISWANKPFFETNGPVEPEHP